MNVLLINPPNVPFTSSGILIEPIDLLGLTTWVKHLGHQASLLDMDVKCLTATDLSNKITHWPDVMVIVFDYHIPLHDVGANEQIKNICAIAKSHGTKVILGGKGATFWPDDKLIEIGADIYVAHEMEYALKEVLSCNWSKSTLSQVSGIRYVIDNKVYQTAEPKDKVDLNELPISDRSLIDLNDYIDVRTLLSSRGCNLRCTFCHVPGFWGWWRGRKSQSVVDEIEILVNHHQSKKILFLDDNATVQTKRMQDIAQGLIDRNIQTTLGCLGTIDRYDEKTLAKMHEGGFRWIHYGAESGDNEQLIAMGKRINQKKILQAVKGTQQAGLRVRTSWIMDMPGLTLDGLKRTQDLILSQGSEEIRLHFLTLRLGSILHQEVMHEETPQFIHNGKQNLNISGVSSQAIEQSVHEIVVELAAQGYAVVRNAAEFKDVQKLKEISPKLKVVSLCPLRYGLGWER